MVEKLGPRRLKLVAADKPPVLAESFLDAAVVEDAQGDGCFADPTCTDESDWGEAFSKTDDLLNQLIPSEEGPRWWGRRFSQYPVFEGEVPVPRLQLKLQTWFESRKL